MVQNGDNTGGVYAENWLHITGRVGHGSSVIDYDYSGYIYSLSHWFPGGEIVPTHSRPVALFPTLLPVEGGGIFLLVQGQTLSSTACFPSGV